MSFLDMAAAWTACPNSDLASSRTAVAPSPLETHQVQELLMLLVKHVIHRGGLLSLRSDVRRSTESDCEKD